MIKYDEWDVFDFFVSEPDIDAANDTRTYHLEENDFHIRTSVMEGPCKVVISMSYKDEFECDYTVDDVARIWKRDDYLMIERKDEKRFYLKRGTHPCFCDE